MTNDTRELLELVYKNAEMGKATIPELLKLTKHKEFAEALRGELEVYKELAGEARGMIYSMWGEEPKGLSLLEKMSTEISLRMSTLRDTSVSHMADMLIKGSSMGISDMAKQMKTYRLAEPRAIALANKLQSAETHNMDNMQRFLHVV